MDLLYHEATFLEQMKERAKKTQHSTAKDAATMAKEANTKRLIIGHFSARYNEIINYYTSENILTEDLEFNCLNPSDCRCVPSIKTPHFPT